MNQLAESFGMGSIELQVPSDYGVKKSGFGEYSGILRILGPVHGSFPKWRAPIKTLKYSHPYYRGPQKGYP